MLLVIQPLKKYLTEHESETLSTCYDKYLASCQDAQRPLSKTASLPEGKCILLLYLVLLSTVQQWGSYVESGGWNSHNFPVAFTNNCFAVITNLQTPTDNYTGGPGTSIPCVKAITKKNFICNVNGGSGWRVQYIAIGN